MSITLQRLVDIRYNDTILFFISFRIIKVGKSPLFLLKKKMLFWKSFHVFKVIIKVGNSFWDFCNNPLKLIKWYYTIFHFFPDYQSWKTSAVSFENKMLSFWKSFYVFKVIIKVGNSFWDFCNNPLILTQWYYTIFKEFENLCVDKKIFKFFKYLNSIALFAI